MFLKIIIVIVVVVVAITLFFVIRKIISCSRVAVRAFDKNDEWLKAEFRRCNVEVFGKKGSGKDLLFAHVIFLRGEPHYSNMPYNALTEVRPLTDLLLESNNYNNVLTGEYVPMRPRFEERQDFYISDGGIFLPCQYNTELNKLYSSMPMTFALSRHLYLMNIHVNVQAPTRIWDKLREQADSYIKVLRSRDYGEYIVINTICYDDYNFAVKGVLPEDNYSSFTAEYRRFRVYKSELEYDTRHFKKMLIDFSEDFDAKKMPFMGYMNALNTILRKKKGVEKHE